MLPRLSCSRQQPHRQERERLKLYHLPSTTVMISNMLKIVLGAVLAAGLLLASDARPLADKNSAIEDKKWTVADLSFMAKSQTVADAILSLMSAGQETGAPALQLDDE